MTSGSAEQRRFPRREAHGTLSGTLTLSGRPYSAVLIDHSFDGMAVRVPKSFVSRMEKDGKEIELLFDQQQINGEVAHSRLDPAEGAVVGISLGGRGGDGSPSFATHDPGWDLIENVETLNNIFTDLAFKGPEAPIHVHTLGGEFSLFVKEVREDRILAELSIPSKRLVPKGRGSFRFEIFQTCHSFESNIRDVDGTSIEIDRPKQVARLLRRETFRVRNGSNSIHVRVRCLGFFLGSKEYEFDAYDLCEHGVGIADVNGMLAFPRGFKIDRIELDSSTGERITAKGSIRASRWDLHTNSYIVGLHIETNSDTERTAWHNTILSARYPSLSFQYQPSDHPEIWNLFDRSGYLDLKPREAFTHVVDVTKKTWQQLSDAGTKISKRILIRRAAEVIGHLQMDRIYPETWCVHHLAIDPKSSKIAAKDIYAVLTDVIAAEGGKYIFSLTQASKPWNQRNYYDFVKDYRFPEHHQLRTMQVYEADLTKGWKLPKHSKIKIDVANRYDRSRILRYFEVQGTELEREAFGLTDEHLDLSKLDHELKPHGLRRERRFLVARLNGEMAGFAQLELGSSGVNIFGLLDMLYLHVLPHFSKQGNELRESLLDAALTEYKSAGKNDVIVALEDGRSEFYSSCGLTYIWDGIRWIALNVSAKRYHAFTQMLYGSLLLQRERIRKRHSTN